MFAALALSLLSASADVTCHRYESADTIVTVCAKRADAPKEWRWRWVFCTDISDGWASVTDYDTHVTWAVAAWQVGGPTHVGRSVRIYTNR